jgi:hypothetical protein
MERSSKRGKIPQQDWPSIIKRYEAGETLASIARTYDCSPPAISYILSRSRGRDATAESTGQSAIGAEQPQLVKGSANAISTTEAPEGKANPEEIPANTAELPTADQIEESGREPPRDVSGNAPDRATDAFDTGSVIVVQQAADHSEAQGHAGRMANGTSPETLGPATASSQGSEPRRTLHLSLPQEDTHRANPQPHSAAGSSTPERSPVQSFGGRQHGLPLPSDRPSPSPDPSAANGGVVRPAPESHRAKDGGAFIDQALRARVEGDVTAFLAAFDAALADDTLESRTGLREATDRLLRAGARTRIELERLEARIPLAVRDNGGHPSPTWRPR